MNSAVHVDEKKIHLNMQAPSTKVTRALLVPAYVGSTAIYNQLLLL